MSSAARSLAPTVKKHSHERRRRRENSLLASTSKKSYIRIKCFIMTTTQILVLAAVAAACVVRALQGFAAFLSHSRGAINYRNTLTRLGLADKNDAVQCSFLSSPPPFSSAYTIEQSVKPSITKGEKKRQFAQKAAVATSLVHSVKEESIFSSSRNYFCDVFRLYHQNALRGRFRCVRQQPKMRRNTRSSYEAWWAQGLLMITDSPSAMSVLHARSPVGSAPIRLINTVWETGHFCVLSHVLDLPSYGASSCDCRRVDRRGRFYEQSYFRTCLPLIANNIFFLH